MIEYRETRQLELIERVRAKYRVPIDQLKASGFMELGFYTKTASGLRWPISPLGLIGAYTLRAHEVSKIGSGFSVSGFFIAMVAREYSTYAFAFNLGVSFYTGFTDGTFLVSSNFDAAQFNDVSQKLYKFSASSPVPAAWADHLEQVKKFQHEGKQVRDAISLAEYFSLLKRMDDYVPTVPPPAAAGPSCISVIVSSIVSAGIIFGCIYFFLFLGDLVGSFYQACRFARDLHDVLKSNGKKAVELDIEGAILDLTKRKPVIPTPELLGTFNLLPHSANYETLPELLRVK